MKLLNKTFNIIEISKAFNKTKHNLIAVESGCGCPGTHTKYVVANQFIVLRQMLEILGFSNEEINKYLYET